MSPRKGGWVATARYSGRENKAGVEADREQDCRVDRAHPGDAGAGGKAR